ncbi:MAG: glutamyl-tRNA reductase [Xanthomonadales bacterium]|nr:glutamyl-tRNA reductase [Xanthomonadales bacterium]
MPLLVTGLNHQTAPVDLRERLAIDAEANDAALADLLARPGVREAALLSTCNRTEIYCQLDDGEETSAGRWLAEHHGIQHGDLDGYLYRHVGDDAVAHLFRVATGLDSLVLGEPQILGQVKDAYQRARRGGGLGMGLERLFQQCFATAKRVRTDTRIGAHPVSVAFAAVRLAEQAFTEIDSATVLLIGAGDTVELAAKHLRDRHARRILIANRTLPHAQALAGQVGGYALPLEALEQHLAEADIVLSATAAREAVLTRAMLERALKARRCRPMLLLDLAVPRDIEASAAALDDVYLYGVDDLEQVVDEGLRSRRESARQAEAIIELEVAHFMAWWRGRDSHHLLRRLRDDANRRRTDALDHAQRQLASGQDPEAVMQTLAHRLTNSLLHAPSARLRDAARRGDRDLLRAAERLFSSQQSAKADPDNENDEHHHAHRTQHPSQT